MRRDIENLRKLQIVVATDPSGVIGVDNRLPWNLPDDLRHFRRLTMGHTLVMGRRTFESIGKPLPGRRNIVLSSRSDWRHDQVETFPGLKEALAATDNETVFVIGGARAFAEALPLADTVHRTLVHKHHPGDVYFPALGPDWEVVWEEEHPADERHTSGFAFQQLRRKG